MFIDRYLRSPRRGSEGGIKLDWCLSSSVPLRTAPEDRGPLSYKHLTTYPLKPTPFCVSDKQVGSLFVRYLDHYFLIIATNFRHVHGMPKDRQGMECARSFGSERIVNLPNPLRQLTDE